MGPDNTEATTVPDNPFNPVNPAEPTGWMGDNLNLDIDFSDLNILDFPDIWELPDEDPFEAEDEDDLFQPSQGHLNYGALHPPQSKIENWNPDTVKMHEGIIGPGTLTEKINLTGQYYADLLKDEEWSPDTVHTETGKNFAQTFGASISPEIQEWKNDWGDDLFGQGDWKDHGADRAYDVDYQYLLDVESEFKDKESELGIDGGADIISNTFLGYDRGIDYELLKAFRDSPEDAKSNLFTLSDSSTGAAGEMVTDIRHDKETLETDKKNAKDTFIKEKENIADIKKERGRTLRGQFKGGGRGGLRRGGSGMGARSRTNLMKGRGLSKDVGLLREKARKSYTDELERLDKNFESDKDTHELKFENKVESELRELIANIEAKEDQFHIADKKQEEGRFTDLMDAMTRLTGADPVLWPTAP